MKSAKMAKRNNDQRVSFFIPYIPLYSIKHSSSIEYPTDKRNAGIWNFAYKRAYNPRPWLALSAHYQAFRGASAECTRVIARDDDATSSPLCVIVSSIRKAVFTVSSRASRKTHVCVGTERGGRATNFESSSTAVRAHWTYALRLFIRGSYTGTILFRFYRTLS